MLPWPCNDIEHIIHSINHIDVPIARTTKHRCITLSFTMSRMTRFIILSIIRFYFSNNESFTVDYKKFTEQILADTHWITIEKGSSEYLSFHKDIIENKRNFTTHSSVSRRYLIPASRNCGRNLY